MVLERTKESDLTRMLRVNNIRVVDPPLRPGAPIRPQVPFNIARASSSASSSASPPRWGAP